MSIKLGIVTVPFFTVNSHRAYADLTLSTIQSKYPLFQVAVANRIRPEKDDLNWLSTNFDNICINDQNNLARAWNKGIETALSNGCDYVVVINLDIIFHPKHFDNLVEFAESDPNKSIIWSGIGRSSAEEVKSNSNPENETKQLVDFCSFMIDHRLFKEVGKFDEKFAPAYFEDKDMLYRVKLANKKVSSTASAAFFHFERGTQAGLLEDFYAKKGLEVFGDPNLGAQVIKDLPAIENTEELYADTSLALFGETTLGVEANRMKYIKKWGGEPGSETLTSPSLL